MDGILERLLVTLEVRLEAFGSVDVAKGHRLSFDPLDAVLVHYVLEGSGWLEAAGQDPVPCDPGSVIILPADTAWTARVERDGAFCELPALDQCAMVKDGLIQFDGTGEEPPALRLLSGAMQPCDRGSFGLFDGLHSPLVERFEGNRTVAGAFAMLSAELAAPGLGSRALAGSLMKLCMVLLIRTHFEELSNESPLVRAIGDRRLARAIAAILEAPADSHSVASLASIAGMSRSAFARAFRTAFDRGPMEFVATARLQHAAELLRSTDIPVKAVAASIGYASRSHFSRAFRAAYGHDPRSYRRRTQVPADPPVSLLGVRESLRLAEDAEAHAAE